MTWSALIFSATLAVAPAQAPSSQPVVFATQIATPRVVVVANLVNPSKKSAFDQQNIDDDQNIGNMTTKVAFHGYKFDNSYQETMNSANRFCSSKAYLVILIPVSFIEMPLYGRPLNESYFANFSNYFFKSWRSLPVEYGFVVNFRSVDLSFGSDVSLMVDWWDSLLSDAIYTYSQSQIASSINHNDTLANYANAIQPEVSLHNSLMKLVAGNLSAVDYQAKLNSAIYIYANRLDSVTLTNFMEIGLSERNNNVERECRG
ncbi:MAG: hypothetical protein H3C43_07905 [Leptonema sp. (in: Bacteria)]|nr:hypothetical protein [Leptonema sp. (in: bacteria)]